MGFLKAGILFGVLWVLAAPASSQQSIYCCDDSQGRPVCGDLLPSACYGRAYREISPQGFVRRHVAAPLTAEEIAKRDAEEKRRKEAAARLAVQRRLDDALIETYMSLEDIDVREERALAETDRSVEEILEREVELLAQRERYEQESEFYAGRQLPREIVTGLRIIEAELAAYRSVMRAKDAEKEAIRARYAADRRRYAELIAEGRVRR